MYDQHSSEEELEVINGSNIDDRVDVDDLPETMLDIDTFKSSPSTTAATCTVESRKRSIAQSSDDEVSFFLDFLFAFFFPVSTLFSVRNRTKWNR